uniref:RRM domain-containing protein n=1 Tax=Heterorhabditis bacteriophora TaxID=37862 RepID=A0A1I7WHR2_HETBA
MYKMDWIENMPLHKIVVVNIMVAEMKYYFFSNASDTFDPVIRSSDDTSACTMMTFKKFLMSQISSHLFVLFRIKYHPDESRKWADAHMENIENMLVLLLNILSSVLKAVLPRMLRLPETEAEKRKKMLLHKTSSIFLRNVPPSVTISELEAVSNIFHSYGDKYEKHNIYYFYMCKRSPGFLRVALADPIPDRKFFRRGWATYKRDVNIKEICWNLNSIRVSVLYTILVVILL